MKKLLGIVVLGLMISGCASGPIVTKTETEAWKIYVSQPTPNKVWGTIYNWKQRGYRYGKVSSWNSNNLEAAIINFFNSPACSQGCIITHIDLDEISEEEQKKLVGKYSPPGFVAKLFPKTKKTVKKVPKKKKSTPESDDNKVVAASMGSGFFVTKAGHLVTNYHVIEECDAVKTNTLGKEVRADIIAVDKTNDLAILKANMNPTKVFPVSNKDVALLQDVIVAGFPLGKKVSSAIKIHKGNVTALAGFGDNYSNFQTDATINQGNSGGPIMNQKGNVVGVAVQLIAAEHAQNVFFGVKSSTLKTFANANNIKFSTPNYREMSNEDLGEFITEATVFLECWMTVAKIKEMIAEEENMKAFYSEHR